MMMALYGEIKYAKLLKSYLHFHPQNWVWYWYTHYYVDVDVE